MWAIGELASLPSESDDKVEGQSANGKKMGLCRFGGRGKQQCKVALLPSLWGFFQIVVADTNILWSRESR
jgi:hypothetical protein